MKKIFFLTILFFVFSFTFPAFSFAQGIGNNNGHTAQGEAEGKIIWEKLQIKELNCEDLSDDNFHSLGMHFMGVMVGDSHEAMDTMMEQMMGKEGEEQMHIAMGKRMSGCEPNASMPQNMPALSGVEGMNGGMMNMMPAPYQTEGFGSGMGGGMMGGGGNSMIGWVFMILFWGFIILAIVALIKWIANQGKHEAKSRPALDILKERYAKGEIDKKEFEEKKYDLKNTQ